MPDIHNVLTAWYERVVITQRAHYLSADHFGRRTYWFGLPTIVLSTLVGTSVFATLQERPEPWVQISVGLASVLAGVLASLQTFLGYAERAEKHRVAGGKYGGLGRELEVLLALPQQASDDAIAQLRTRMEALALESPNNPVWIYQSAEPKVQPLPPKPRND